MNYSKLKISALIFLIFIFSGLISCSKKSNETADNMVKEADLENINSNDFKENDDDLLNVDYSEFYDDLAPHGEWIEVKGNDIGVDLKKGTASGNEHRTISISELFGVKEAFADDVNFGAFFVWKPAPNLAVGISAGEPVAYTPYTNGQWIYSSNGWYFKAASEPEEITHHYGRWVYSPALGWVWVPGRVWAPAWVDWREQDDYVAWSPVPPGVYIVNNVIIEPPVYEERYVIVERRHFIEPDIYRYTYKENKHKIKITEWRRSDGIIVINNTVINRGPDVTIIKSITGRSFEPVTIKYVTGKNKVKYTENEYDVYSPEFKKIRKEVKYSGPVSKPKKFSDYQSASRNEFGKNEKNAIGDENKGREDLKQNKIENKGNPENNFKERKYIDDKNMKNGKNNSGDKNSGDNKEKNEQGKDHKKNKDNNKGNDKNENRDKSNGKDKNNKNNKSDNPEIKDKGNKDKGNKDKSGNDKGNKKFKNDTYKQKNDHNKDNNRKSGKQNDYQKHGNDGNSNMKEQNRSKNEKSNKKNK